MKKLLLLFMSVTLLTACSDDDSSGNITTMPFSFTGNWTMTNYAAFTPEPIAVNQGDVVWKFDTDNNTITMTNAGEPFLSSVGTFSYALEGDNAIIITIDDYDQKYFYTYDQMGLRLESDMAASDGPIMRFKKI